MSREAERLETALADFEKLAALAWNIREARDDAGDVPAVRMLSEQLTSVLDRCCAADNALGDRVNAWAEAAASAALANLRELARPALALLAALEYAEADAPAMEDLCGVRNYLEAEAKLDPASAAAKLAERVRKVRERIEGAEAGYAA